MVPWPIALLAIFYAIIATIASSMAWKVMIGVSERPFFWPALWMVLSAGATYGLVMFKPWGRKLAVWTSMLMMITIWSIAALLVVGREPGWALLTTVVAGLQMIPVRYLGQPAVKTLFADYSALRP